MQALEGQFAQYYNRRKKRSGAFWSDRYHTVMIDSLAVGGRDFVEEVGGRIPNRMKVVVESMGDEGEPWIVREDQEAYG